MTPGYNIDPDYVDVAERIRLFYEQFPEGRLTTAKVWVETVGWPSGNHPDDGHPMVETHHYACCVAQAWRTPDDPHPCDGVAWEPIPGPTPFTRDSELMNAQTSAWGRAIVAAGIPAKKIATSQDVQARTQQEPPPDDGGKEQHRKDMARIAILLKELDELDPQTDWKEQSRGWTREQFGKHSAADLTHQEAASLAAWLDAAKESEKKNLADRMAETEALVDAEDLPFG